MQRKFWPARLLLMLRLLGIRIRAACKGVGVSSATSPRKLLDLRNANVLRKLSRCETGAALWQLLSNCELERRQLPPCMLLPNPKLAMLSLKLSETSESSGLLYLVRLMQKVTSGVGVRREVGGAVVVTLSNHAVKDRSLLVREHLLSELSNRLLDSLL